MINDVEKNDVNQSDLNQEVQEEEINENEAMMNDSENNYELVIADLKNKLISSEDKYLRLYADFENLRRRTTKERLEYSQNANISCAKKFLFILDDLERALNATDSENVLYDGIRLISGKVHQVLSDLGIKKMDIKINVDELDTDKHEAISSVSQSDEKLRNKIVAVVENGYIANDSVIRFAKVILGS